MQIESLKIYCDVVRFHSFSRGAEANDVLQSSVSQTIQNIEENLGVSLIDRSRRPWAVTEEGKVFYEGCREVVDRYSEVVAEVRDRSAAVDSVIRVAAIYSLNFADMGRSVQQFNQLHPGAKVLDSASKTPPSISKLRQSAPRSRTRTSPPPIAVRLPSELRISANPVGSPSISQTAGS